MSENQEVKPQYKENEFSSAIDCKNCSRTNGMRLLAAWNSSVEPGVMNVRYECVSCQFRIWDRLAIPEAKP